MKFPIADFTVGQFVLNVDVPERGHLWESRGPSAELWLTEQDGQVRRKCPLIHPQLHHTFAALRTEEQMRRFADKHGLLDRRQGAVTHAHSDGRGFDVGVLAAEPLSLWRKAIREMATLLQLWSLVKTSTTGRLGQFVVWPTRSRIFIRFACTITPPHKLLPIHRNTPQPPGLPYLRLPDIEGHTKSASGADLINGQEVEIVSIEFGREEDVATLRQSWRYGDPLGPAHLHICNTINAHVRDHIQLVIGVNP